MNIYLLVLDYSYCGNYEQGFEIIGAYSNFEKARKVFEKEKEKQKTYDSQNEYNKIEETDSTYTSWKDGFYDEEHTALRIIKKQVK